MRIDAYNQVAQLYNTTNTKSVSATKATAATRRDQLSISSTGKDIQVAKKAVAEAADIRTDLVADIKAQMKAGTYDVSTEEFADKLLAKMNSIF